MANVSSTGKVGIYFVVNGEIVFDAVPLDQGESYGDAIDYSGHYEYWQACIPQNQTETLFKSHAYDYFPRGRVVYFKRTNSHRLYAECCITKADIEKVVALFQLSDYRLARDEHDQCAGCNQEYNEY